MKRMSGILWERFTRFSWRAVENDFFVSLMNFIKGVLRRFGDPCCYRVPKYHDLEIGKICHVRM